MSSSLTIHHFLQSVRLIHQYAQQHGLHVWLENRKNSNVFEVCLLDSGGNTTQNIRSLSSEDYDLLQTRDFNPGTYSIKPYNRWGEEELGKHSAAIADCLLAMPGEMREKFYDDWTYRQGFNWVTVWQEHLDNTAWFGDSWESILQSLKPKTWENFWKNYIVEIETWLHENPAMASIILERFFAYLPSENFSDDWIVASSQVIYGIFKEEPAKIKDYSLYLPFLKKMLNEEHNLFKPQEATIHCLNIPKEDIYIYFKSHGLLGGQYMKVANAVVEFMGRSSELKQHGLQQVDVIENKDESLRAYFTFNQAKELNHVALMDILLGIMDNFLNHKNDLHQETSGEPIFLNHKLLAQVGKTSIATWFLQQSLPQKDLSKGKARKL